MMITVQADIFAEVDVWVFLVVVLLCFVFKEKVCAMIKKRGKGKHISL